MYADGVILPKEVVEYVAHNINTNLRDLEGAMIALLAQEALVKKEIDIEITYERRRTPIPVIPG
jgi:chromosomal replication initiator protein